MRVLPVQYESPGSPETVFGGRCCSTNCRLGSWGGIMFHAMLKNSACMLLKLGVEARECRMPGWQIGGLVP